MPIVRLSCPSSRRAKGNKAFTLTEVVLALGVIALAFVPVMGLLPAGLNVSRKAIDTTIEAQIVQQFTNQAQQADFSNLSGLAASGPYYFNNQGNETSDTASAVYKVGLDITSRTTLPSNVATQKLATITICVLKMTEAGQDPDPLKNPASNKIIVLIADNGR